MAKTRAQRRLARQTAPVARVQNSNPSSDRDIAIPAGLHDSGSPREQLRDAWLAEKSAEIATCAAVRAARAAGLSWHQVGLVVGYTAEGARRRWGPLLGEVQL